MQADLNKLLEQNPSWQPWFATTAQALSAHEHLEVAAFAQQAVLIFRRVWKLRKAKSAALGSSVSVPDEIDLLGLLAVAASIRARTWKQPISKLIEQEARNRLAALSLNRLIAELRQKDYADVMRSPEEFAATCDLSQAFASAIAPRRVGSVLLNRQKLRVRLAAFLANGSRSDAEIEAHAKAVFAYNNLAATQQNELCARLGVPLLRTFADVQLTEIAQLFKAWSPLVGFVEANPRFRPHEQFERLRKNLVNTLRQQWTDLPGMACEDAVSEAVMQTSRFRYETSFFRWLLTFALSRMRAEHRHHRGDTELFSEEGDEGADSEVEHSAVPLKSLLSEEQALAWRERFLLVESFFKGEGSARVKEIWEALLSLSEGAERLSDNELADRLSQTTGQSVPINTVAGTRRRLRQRLGVLHFVLDVVPQGAPDLPGDLSVLDWVDRSFGLSTQDVPTLRGLAGLARAAHADAGSLVGALVARWLTEFAQVDALAVRTVTGELIAERSRVCGPCFSRVAQETRVERALMAMNNRDNIDRMKMLRGFAKDLQMSPWLAPCWCLGVWCGRAPAETVEILRPALTEKSSLLRLVYLVSEFPRLESS